MLLLVQSGLNMFARPMDQQKYEHHLKSLCEIQLLISLASPWRNRMFHKAQIVLCWLPIHEKQIISLESLRISNSFLMSITEGSSQYVSFILRFNGICIPECRGLDVDNVNIWNIHLIVNTLYVIRNTTHRALSFCAMFGSYIRR